MWLRNFDNLMLSMLLPNTSYISTTSTSTAYELGTSTSGYGDGYINGMATNGTIVKFDIGAASTSSSAYYYPAVVWCDNAICLGTGNTEVSYDDYKLAGTNILTSGRTSRSNTLNYNADTGKWERTITFSYANNSNADITISEWGIWRGNGRAAGSSSGYTNSEQTILLYREVLAEPITIPVDVTAELTFTVEVPMQNHP